MDNLEWVYNEPVEEFPVVDMDAEGNILSVRINPALPSEAHPEPTVYTRQDGLRYDPNLIMDMPRGRQPGPADMSHPPQVTTVAGPNLVAALIFAQFPLDPLRLSARKPSPSTKLNAAQRRAAKIAAGKLKVGADGRLSG